MEKYIEAIIEIVLEHVRCEHQLIEEFPHGPKFDDPTYSLDNEQEVIKKCLKYTEIAKLPDKEEMIEKQARVMHDDLYGSLIKCDYQCNAMGRFRIQVRKIVEVK